MTLVIPSWQIFLLICVVLAAIIIVVRIVYFKRVTERAAARVLSMTEEAISMSGLPVSPGTRIGGYRIEEKLEDGGMAIEYLGKDETGYPFIIKIPRPKHLDNEEYMERFRREAAILKRLEHPHIVKLAETGSLKEKDREIPYMILEYIEGKDLAQVLRAEAPLPPERAVEIIKGISRALEAVHKEGVIHRNIKPSSIRLTERGEVKLLNFGIAKALGVDTITQIGAAMGTVLYMAPEQMGDEKIDLRADLYSVGVIFYRLITGKDPYNAKTVPQLLNMKLNDDPPNPCSIDPRISDELGSAILKLLQRDREKRYESVAALLEDLDTIVPAREKAPECDNEDEQLKEKAESS